MNDVPYIPNCPADHDVSMPGPHFSPECTSVGVPNSPPVVHHVPEPSGSLLVGVALGIVILLQRKR